MNYKKALTNPLYIMGGVIKKLSPYIKNDMLYIGLRYYAAMGKRMNWDNPQTFNEKLNWMKLYLQDSLYTKMADKYEVKNIVSEIAPEIVVPCYGVWNSFDEIDFSKLPDQFVLKATHDSSGATICRDKNKFNKEKAKNKFDKCLKRNWYSNSKEWVYKNIKPRIIADMLLDDHSGKELQDYKFWCFNGEPKVMYITNKGEHIYENFYDMDFLP